MDTTQKNREETRKRRRPDQEGQKKRQAEQSSPQRRRPAEAPAEEPQRRRRPAQTAPEESQRRKSPEKAGDSRKRRRPDDRQQRRTRPDTQREEGVHYTAPQGTGTRKSASQPTLEERRAARQKAARQNQPDPNQKRTLKDNPLQRFMDGIKPNPGQQEDPAEEAKKRQEKRAKEAERKRQQAQRNNTPAVIYTQPEVFNRNVFLVRLITVLTVVVAMIVCMSIFFRIETITVAGAKTYTPWAVREASGITEGTGLLTFSRAKANAQIQAKLPYVENSRIGIKLPNTVIIYIEEAEVTYAIKSSDGIWYLMTSSGRVVEQIDNSEAGEHTQISGVTIQTPTIGEPAVAQEEAVPIPTETEASTDPTQSEETTEPYVPSIFTGALRLNAVLEILKALEANGIVGQAASVDVTRLEDILLWYGTRYQVNLGDTSRMEYKIACMKDAILNMSEFDSGVLDVSFDIWEDKVGFTPFA